MYNPISPSDQFIDITVFQNLSIIKLEVYNLNDKYVYVRTLN